ARLRIDCLRLVCFGHFRARRLIGSRPSKTLQPQRRAIQRRANELLHGICAWNWDARWRPDPVSVIARMRPPTRRRGEKIFRVPRNRLQRARAKQRPCPANRGDTISYSAGSRELILNKTVRSEFQRVTISAVSVSKRIDLR